MRSVEVIERPEAAAAALDPIRARLLAELSEPASASALAERIGMPRQKVNYHLHTLEAHGLVRFVEERPRRGLKERVLVATAGSYVVSPGALGAASVDPSRTRDRLSADYAIALAARVIRELGLLARRAAQARLRLPVLALDAEIRFRSPAERAQFAAELTDAVTRLAARYHDGAAPDGRAYRLMLAAHPIPAPDQPEPDSEESP
ncbi:MAG: helix-turn-helix transcriptional regulator [Chloroflexi bacterium]|nr:helix-turn-helix transcriptional regulator [Chloroflexota bacterium]